MYCQCTEAVVDGKTCRKRLAVIPETDAWAVSNFATVVGVQMAPTRPPISVGVLPSTVPDPGAADQLTACPATPRRWTSTARIRMESGSGCPAWMLQQKTSESPTGSTPARAPTGKYGAVAKGA